MSGWYSGADHLSNIQKFTRLNRTTWENFMLRIHAHGAQLITRTLLDETMAMVEEKNEEFEAAPHVCQSLKDHRGRAVRQTLARGRRPSQTRDAAAGDLARDPLSSCRHSQSKELEQRGRRATRGRCQDAHGASSLEALSVGQKIQLPPEAI